MTGLTYYSVFSGVEAASLAWGPLGFRPLLLSEVDPFCCAVLSARLPGVPNAGDITGIDWGKCAKRYGKPDVIVGGSPCQSFSIAGRREGLAGASGLMWEYVRCVREVMPRWLVWENVPGALSSSDGEDFRCLLRSLDELGYCLAWRVLDAQYFGVAQRRRRLFVVGCLGSMRSAPVLFEPGSLRRDFKKGAAARASLAARAGGGASCAGFKFHQGSGAGGIGYAPERSPTLTADWHNPAVLAVRMREGCAGGGKGPLVQEDVSDTLATRNDQTIFCMSDTQTHAGVGEGVCNTITAHCSKDAPVAFVQNVRNEVRKFGGDGATVGALAASPGMKQTCYVSHAGTVRRLTPRECERLQGMSDDWTMVPYRGKPAEECPDGPRYKAIGNSMAVPVMRWIGERIASVDGDAL